MKNEEIRREAGGREAMTRSRGLFLAGAWVAIALGLAIMGSWAPGSSASAQGRRVPSPTVRPAGELSAVEALRLGRYERALEAAKRDLAATPQSVPALSALVGALLETGARRRGGGRGSRLSCRRVPNPPTHGTPWARSSSSRDGGPMPRLLSPRPSPARRRIRWPPRRPWAYCSTSAVSAPKPIARFQKLIAAYNAGRAKTAPRI